MIEPLIRSILIADEAVKAIASDRVFFLIKPQDKRREAAVVITLVSEQHYHAMDGRLPYTTGTLQLDCFASTYEEAKQLAAAVRDAIDKPTAAPIDWIDVEATRDIFAEPLEGTAFPLCGVSVDAEYSINQENP